MKKMTPNFMFYTLAILSISCLYICHGEESGIKDVTSLIHLKGEGVIAGYGDFNSDRATDVFMISHQWSTLYVYFWDVTKQIFKPAQRLLQAASDYNIVNIGLADFNGDGNMDVLLSSRKKANTEEVVVEIYYGDKKSLNKGNFSAVMSDQPTLVDVNGDLLPDLFSTYIDKNDKVRAYWISKISSKTKAHSFVLENQFLSMITTSLVTPNSNAFIDCTGDLHSDLLVKSIDDHKNILFETWEQNTGMTNLTLNKNVIMLSTINETIVHVGQMSFTDIDGDHKIDLVLPVCLNIDCSSSAIYAKTLSDESPWKMMINNENADWQFPLRDMLNQTPFPVTLRFNDITMDGMMDAVAILQEKGTKNGKKYFPAYFSNARCMAIKHCSGNRTFVVSPIDLGLSVGDSLVPVVVSLMDVNENGVLDFMITLESSNAASKIKRYHTRVLLSEQTNDAAFVKVAVLSGLKSVPKYGSNQIGAVVHLATTNTDGSSMLGANVQLSQSSYLSLQLPYVIFGLGRSPNFVEEIQVGLPKGPQKVNRVKSWTAIIPNAQVIVIPYPKDEPYDWVTKLLVTPGKLLLQTGGVLIGTILLIGGLILILHIKEKKEDDREKRRDAHKFHFDAL